MSTNSPDLSAVSLTIAGIGRSSQRPPKTTQATAPETYTIVRTRNRVVAQPESELPNIEQQPPRDITSSTRTEIGVGSDQPANASHSHQGSKAPSRSTHPKDRKTEAIPRPAYPKDRKTEAPKRPGLPSRRDILSDERAVYRESMGPDRDRLVHERMVVSRRPSPSHQRSKAHSDRHRRDDQMRGRSSVRHEGRSKQSPTPTRGILRSPSAHAWPGDVSSAVRRATPEDPNARRVSFHKKIDVTTVSPQPSTNFQASLSQGVGQSKAPPPMPRESYRRAHDLRGRDGRAQRPRDEQDDVERYHYKHTRRPSPRDRLRTSPGAKSRATTMDTEPIDRRSRFARAFSESPSRERSQRYLDEA